MYKSCNLSDGKKVTKKRCEVVISNRKRPLNVDKLLKSGNEGRKTEK